MPTTEPCRHGNYGHCPLCVSTTTGFGVTMPTADLQPGAMVQTTWGVLEDYRQQIATRDEKIADLILERDALSARLAQMKIIATLVKD